ncbi:MAG: TonB-dependent receptor [Bacteroidales bacterium]|nr:TonB-dependent receptor [Bacteroidales bacterium]
MKRLHRLFSIIVLMFLGLSPLFAQTVITGTVTDENKEPLSGATVIIKGTTQGTFTDAFGNYSIAVTEQDAILSFSFIGYISLDETVGRRTQINVSLLLDLESLEEVVVVGYGTQRKSDLTGSVSAVNVEDLDRSTSTNLTDRLQGQVAGVSVVTSGQPGGTGDIKIRGTSFFGGNNPLYVVDGVLTDDSPNLNPYDIESVQILKDASSSAIYGSRAANGVVVITTKKGKSGNPVVNAIAQVGLQRIPGRIDVTDNYEFARINNVAHDNSGIPRMSKADVDFDPDVNTDWQEEVFNKQALMQDFNLSVSSGSQKYNAYISLNNTYTEGTIQGSLFDRIGARVNTDFTPWKRLIIGQNLSVSRSRISGLSKQYSGTIATYTVSNLPIIPVYDPYKTSGYGYGDVEAAYTFVPNPVAQQDLMKSMDRETQILSNVYLDLEILDGLKYHFSVGVNSNFNQSKAYNPRFLIRMGGSDIQSRLFQERGESSTISLENRLTYTKTFGDHEISAMVTHAEQEINGAYQETETLDGHLKEPYFWEISASSASSQSKGGQFSSAIRSYLGRFTYKFKDRYLLTAILRRDGSSKFASENRWGTFPSVSAGWNIAKEDFFTLDAISDLKIRAGYGVVGNSSIGDYAYQSLVRSGVADGVNYNMGPEGALVIGTTRGALSNRDISWETLRETNLGLDLRLFEGQLEFNADYYMGNLEGLLVAVPVPGTIGPADATTVTVNAVNMTRNGWETSLTYRRVIGDFSFSVTTNAFHTNNEITYLPFGVDEFPGTNSTSRLGLPLGQLFLVEYLGIYTSQDQINMDGVTITGKVPVIGDARYRDVNGRDEDGNLTGEPDGNINFDDDRQIWGNPIPKMQYGLNFEVSWKGFDLYGFFQGVTKRDVYNSYYYELNASHITNYSIDYDPYIDGVGTDPRPVYGDVANNFPSTRFVENGAYLRLKNLQIGYSIPFEKFTKLRVYLSAQNLFTITKYRGVDPEFEGGVFNPGIDRMNYPQVRMLSAGVNLTL